MTISGADVNVSGSATLTLSGGNLTSFGPAGAGGTLLVSSGSLDVQGGQVSLLGGNGMSVNGADGSVTVTGGELRLSGGNLTTGSLDFSSGSGSVVVSNSSAFNVTKVTSLGDATNPLTIEAGLFSTGSLTSASVVPPPTVLIADLSPGTPALTIGTDNSDSNFEGLIADANGPGGIKKVGTGTLSLSAANTYTGGTTIDGGTLLANNTTGSATGSGAVQVNSGATLGGTGSTSGAVNATGGTIAPGASVGVLSVGSVTFDANSTFAVELAGSGGVAGTDFDQLAVTGTAQISAGATLDVVLDGNFSPSTGDVFPVLVAGDLNSTFDNQNLPGAYAWGVDYNATTLTVEVLALLGDMNADDNITTADAPLFIQALVNPSGYAAAFPLLDGDVIGDMNQNGTFDFGDIAGFNALFAGPASAGTQAVPEPTTLSLAVILLLGIATRPRRRV